MSVDVECVATGKSHNDRAVCQVAVVDSDAHVLLNVYVRPDKAIVSFLTPITGISAGSFQAKQPISLEEAKARVYALLGSDVILVGQGVENDIRWLGLQQGVHYSRAEDLSEHFKVYNPKYANWNFFSLRHEADVLLGSTSSGSHDASQDAIVCILVRIPLRFIL